MMSGFARVPATVESGWMSAAAVARLRSLLAEDEQVRAAAPLPEVDQVVHVPGLPLTSVITTCLVRYADRPALAQRVKTLRTDPLAGRTQIDSPAGYQSISFRDLHERIMALAAAWTAVPGLRPGDVVASMGFTGIEYTVVNLANVFLGAVGVPLQSSSSAEQLAPIVADTQPRIFATSIDTLPTAIELVVAAPSVQRLVVFDCVPGDDNHRDLLEATAARLAVASHSAILVNLAEELKTGATLPAPEPFVPAGDDDPLSMLIYTSGSTGSPKGGSLTSSVIRSFWLEPFLPQRLDVPEILDHTLPLNHGFGQSLLFSGLAAGGTGYFASSNDTSSLFDDLPLVRPTVIALVPRVSEIVHQRYLRVAEPFTGGPDSFDEAALARIRNDFFGGRVVAALCSGAPLSATLRTFMSRCLEVELLDAYGSTETGGVAIVNGLVQRPPVLAYRLVDVPELDYYTSDRPYPRGELYIKTSTQLRGYFNRPDATASAFDADGYYHTGDIMAEIGPDHLQYIDRRNFVLKLSQGEFVALAHLDAVFATSPYVRQIFVYGTSDQSYLLAVVVPNTDELNQNDPAPAIRQSLQQIGIDAGLNTYEIPRDVIIETEPFTLDNRLLTGIGKLSRTALTARYRSQLDTLYTQMGGQRDHKLERLRLDGQQRSTLDTVIAIAAITLDIPLSASITADAKFTDLGGDSLSGLTFVTSLEKVFGIPVPIQVVVSPTSTLSSVSTYLDTQHASASDIPTAYSVHGARCTSNAAVRHRPVAGQIHRHGNPHRSRHLAASG